MVELIVFIVLMTLGYSFGVYAENRHFRSIMAREKLLSRVPAIASKQLPSLQPPPATFLVSGSVAQYSKDNILSRRAKLGVVKEKKSPGSLKIGKKGARASW